MTRKLSNWIDSFVEYTAILPSEPIVRRWAGIAAVSAVLERKVWAVSMGKRLYPNMYIFLVAPPGTGKTILVTEVRELWAEVKTMHIAASSLTKASFIDELSEAERNITFLNRTPAVETYHALALASNELSVLLPEHNSEFMSVLTDIWDSLPYSEKRRTMDLTRDIPKPCFNMIACTNPAFLSRLLPDGAWDEGFMARVILIYSGVQELFDFFNIPESNAGLHKKLKQDLVEIAAQAGELTYQQETKDLILDWYRAGGPPRPEHPKLRNYISRRHMHVLKLCQIISLSEGNDKIITPRHASTAIEWLIESETRIPDIFKAMTSGGDMEVIEGCWHFAYKLYITTKETPIREALFVQYLQQRVPAHSISRIMEVMVKSGILHEDNVNKIGTCYRPRKWEKF